MASSTPDSPAQQTTAGTAAPAPKAAEPFRSRGAAAASSARACDGLGLRTNVLGQPLDGVDAETSWVDEAIWSRLNQVERQRLWDLTQEMLKAKSATMGEAPAESRSEVHPKQGTMEEMSQQLHELRSKSHQLHVEQGKLHRECQDLMQMAFDLSKRKDMVQFQNDDIQRSCIQLQKKLEAMRAEADQNADLNDVDGASGLAFPAAGS